MFVPLICEPPSILEIDQDGDDHVIVVPVARDDNTSRIVTVDSHLALTWSGGGSFFEFSFEISVMFLDGNGESFSTQDREIARRYLPEEARKLVMPIVLRCYERLLRHVRPDLIYRVTKVRHPNARALEKHHLLTRLLEHYFYRVIDTGTDPMGRMFWWLQL